MFTYTIMLINMVKLLQSDIYYLETEGLVVVEYLHDAWEALPDVLGAECDAGIQQGPVVRQLLLLYINNH